MDGVLAATIGGIVALIFWGISDWLASKNSKTHTNMAVNLGIHVTAGSILFLTFLLSDAAWPNLKQFLLLLLAASFFTAGYMMFIRALSIGQAGIVVPLLNTFPLFAFLASFIFIGTTFPLFALFAMMVIVIGAILVGTDKLNKKKIKDHLTEEVILAVGAALVIGINVFILNTIVQELSWETIAGLEAFATAIIVVIVSLIKNHKAAISTLKEIHHNKIAIISGLMIVFGTTGFYVGGELSGDLIIPSVLASASVLVTSALAAIFDHEKIILIRRLGAVMVVVGIIILNFQ